MRSHVKIGLFALLSLCFASETFAQDKSNGCGIGWYFLKEKTILSSTVRQTTNSVSPSSFSMTSGTSGCAQHALVLEEFRSLHYLEANFDHLRFDVARGEGAYLTGFAATLGCEPSAFAGVAQANYGYLFLNSTPDQAGEVLGRTRELMNNSQELASFCKRT